MKKTGIIVSIILAIPALWFLLLIGIGFSSNETDNPAYWGKYQAGEYELSQPVFIIHDDGKDYLIPESKNTRCLGRHKLAPESIAEFNTNPAKASVAADKHKDDIVKLKKLAESSKALAIAAGEKAKRKEAYVLQFIALKTQTAIKANTRYIQKRGFEAFSAVAASSVFQMCGVQD